MITTRLGWRIYGSTNRWDAVKHGVRMNTNNLDDLCKMIDLHEADMKKPLFEDFHKLMEKRGHFSR